MVCSEDLGMAYLILRPGVVLEVAGRFEEKYTMETAETMETMGQWDISMTKVEFRDKEAGTISWLL